jgi:hypothetical protein
MTEGSSATPQDPRGNGKRGHNAFSNVFGLNGQRRSNSGAYVPRHMPVQERLPGLADIVGCLAHVMEEYFVADELTIINEDLKIYKPFHGEGIS